MQIVFVREAKEITGSAGELLGVTGKAAGDDASSVYIPGVGIRRPNILKKGTGGTREFTGGKQGGGGRIAGADYGAKAGGLVIGNLGKNDKGQFTAVDPNKTDEERVAGLSKGDAQAAQQYARGYAIDEATLKRLGEAGLLEVDKKGRNVVSFGARKAMLMSQQTAGQMAERNKKNEAAAAEKKAEEKKKAGEAAAEAKAAKRDAQRKEEQIKAKAEAKVERDAAITKAAADKEAAQIKAVAQAEAAQQKQQEIQRKTMNETAVKAGLDRSEVDALLKFVNGEDLEYGSPLAKQLLRRGLITEVQGEKGYMIGALASPFLNAAVSGNARAAKDMLSQYGVQKRAAEAASAAEAQLLVPKINEIGGAAASVNVRTIGATGGAKMLPFTPILKKTKELGGGQRRLDWIVFPRIGGGAGRGGLLGVAQKAINIVFGKS